MIAVGVIVLVSSVVLAIVVAFALSTERARLWWARRAQSRPEIPLSQYQDMPYFTAEELAKYEVRMAPLRVRRRAVRLADRPPVAPACLRRAGATGPHRRVNVMAEWKLTGPSGSPVLTGLNVDQVSRIVDRFPGSTVELMITDDDASCSSGIHPSQMSRCPAEASGHWPDGRAG